MLLTYMESVLKCDWLFRDLNIGHWLLEIISTLDNFHSSLKKNNNNNKKPNPKKTNYIVFYKKTLCAAMVSPVNAVFSLVLGTAVSDAS